MVIGVVVSVTVDLVLASYIIRPTVKTQISRLGTGGRLSLTSPFNTLSKWGCQLGIKCSMDCGGHSRSDPYSRLPKPLSHSWITEGCCVLTCWFMILVWATPWNERQSDHRSNHAHPIKVIFKGFREGKKVLTIFFNRRKNVVWRIDILQRNRKWSI